VGVELVNDDDVHHAQSPSFSRLQGRRVRLISCDDPHTRLQPGTRGRVTFVDGLGTVHVAWDDGSRLGLIPGVDQWEVDAADAPDGDGGDDVWNGEGQP
jgi:hypothetical protein